MSTKPNASTSSTNQTFASSNLEWSNEKCIEMSLEDNFPSAVNCLATQKKIIDRFLNFYLGAKLQNGISVYDLTYSVISIMPLHHRTEDFIWSDVHYSPDGTLFFLTPEDKLRAEIKITLDRTSKSNHNSSASTATGNHCKTNGDEIRLNLNIKHDNTNVYNATNVPGKFSRTVNKDDEFRRSCGTNERPKFTSSPNDTRVKKPELKIPEHITWFSNKRKRVTDADLSDRIEYGPKENSAFNRNCNQLLEEWETNRNSRIFLKYFCGVVALTMMRATTKSYKHIVDVFCSRKFLTYIEYDTQDLRVPNIKFNYSIPHKRCFKYCYRAFSKRGINIRVMFAKLVVNSYHIDSKRRKYTISGNSLKWNIFKVTVLAHTADYGMGLLSLIQTVQSLDKRINTVIVDVTYCPHTAYSWDRVIKFMNTYMLATSNQRTHYWARIINGDYFKDLTCTNNYALAVILSVFIEKLSNSSSVWGSKWLKCNGDKMVEGNNDELNKYKELGRNMYERFICRREDIVGLQNDESVNNELRKASEASSNVKNEKEKKVAFHVETDDVKKFIQGLGDRMSRKDYFENLFDELDSEEGIEDDKYFF